MNSYEVSIEFDRGSVCLDFGNAERETAGGRYRAYALMSESIDGVNWIADVSAIEVLVGRDWLRTDLPLDEKAKIAEYLETEKEQEQLEDEELETV